MVLMCSASQLYAEPTIDYTQAITSLITHLLNDLPLQRFLLGNSAQLHTKLNYFTHVLRLVILLSFSPDGFISCQKLVA